MVSPSANFASLLVLLCPSLSLRLHPKDAVLIEVLDAKLSLGLSRAERGRQIEATLDWVLSCPAGWGMESRATQCSQRVMPAQTSSNLSHPPGFDYFPTNALEGKREHKEVDFFSLSYF